MKRQSTKIDIPALIAEAREVQKNTARDFAGRVSPYDFAVRVQQALEYIQKKGGVAK